MEGFPQITALWAPPGTVPCWSPAKSSSDSLDQNLRGRPISTLLMRTLDGSRPCLSQVSRLSWPAGVLGLTSASCGVGACGHQRAPQLPSRSSLPTQGVIPRPLAGLSPCAGDPAREEPLLGLGGQQLALAGSCPQRSREPWVCAPVVLAPAWGLGLPGWLWCPPLWGLWGWPTSWILFLTLDRNPGQS